MNFYLFFNFFLVFSFCFQLKIINSNYSGKWKDRLPYYKLKLNGDSRPTNCNKQNSSSVPEGPVNIKTTKPFYPNLKSNLVFHSPISSKSSFPSKYSGYSSHQLSPPYNQRQKHKLPSLKKPWWPLLHPTFPPSPPLPQFIGPEKRTEQSASSIDSLTIHQLYKNTLNALCRLLPRLLRNLSYEECIVSGRKAARYIRPIIRKQSEQASEEDKTLTNKVDQVNRWHKYRLKLPQSKTVKELIEPWYFSGLTKENQKIGKKNCGN
ncbi:unnamed protein product [Meloidogyne enterolobii]|uniref:Uncharacterized protein n=1 Tax=Meloidogyne enterolobii TaxID=390850 RepID=A0ACB0XLE3_MELEN